MRLRRAAFGLPLLAACLLVSACAGNGEFTLFGYTTAPQYSREIRTLRVPIFKNKSWWRDLEFPLTEEIIKQIELKSGWKVVSHGNADAELTGTITQVRKRVIYDNPLNEIREGEWTLQVDVCFADLRSAALVGEPPDNLSGDVPPPVIDPRHPTTRRCVPVVRTRSFTPELGQSTATTQHAVIHDLAVQIASMLEKPW